MYVYILLTLVNLVLALVEETCSIENKQCGHQLNHYNQSKPDARGEYI